MAKVILGYAWPPNGRYNQTGLRRQMPHLPRWSGVPWDHAGMDRLYGALQALEFVRSLQWPTPALAFDSAFSNQE
jgi:hypothetical protein